MAFRMLSRNLQLTKSTPSWKNLSLKPPSSSLSYVSSPILGAPRLASESLFSGKRALHPMSQSLQTRYFHIKPTAGLNGKARKRLIRENEFMKANATSFQSNGTVQTNLTDKPLTYKLSFLVAEWVIQAFGKVISTALVVVTVIGTIASTEYLVERFGTNPKDGSTSTPPTKQADGTFWIVPSTKSDQKETVGPVVAEEVNVTFDDVKGVDEAKQELKDIVEFLKTPKKFTKLGGTLPKGVLLYGPPGTGKTLLARAVAGEAQVPFFQTSGSEFDEEYVGVGARRVRELFKAAKKSAPCVIFIDEIDSVGSKRANPGNHPYANQTINQLLTEMDGFGADTGIVIIGATNRKDHLDEALLRTGRLDVSVRVPLPDLNGRTQLLQLYLQKVVTGADVDVATLARRTIGFTGSDIKSLVNLAAVKAATENQTSIKQSYFNHSRDKIIMGPERKSFVPSEEDSRITAFHEGGHTLVAHYTPDSTPLHKVTITPRGDALGYTEYLPTEDQSHSKKSQMLAQIDSLMGGRVAEELIFGSDKVTSGASSDLQRASEIASRMVTSYGMSDKVGLRCFPSNPSEMSISPKITEEIDTEISALLSDSYERAKTILMDHHGELCALAEALIKHETLYEADVKKIIEEHSSDL